MLSIIVLNYNRLKYTKQTVENLIAITKVPHEFIFVDNGSVDGTREYLKSLEHKTNAKKVTYVFNDKNLGVGGGRNSGLVKATGDYLMTIDDDILVPEGYDQKFKDACDKVENLGITGVNVEKKSFKSVDFEGVTLQVKKGNLGGGCLCLPRRVFEQVGYYMDEFVYGMEDCDMYNRISFLKLISGYIDTPGVHLDEKENPLYVRLKHKVHKRRSHPYNRMANKAYKYRRRRLPIYHPYNPNLKVDATLFDKAILDGYKSGQ